MVFQERFVICTKDYFRSSLPKIHDGVAIFPSDEYTWLFYGIYP